MSSKCLLENTEDVYCPRLPREVLVIIFQFYVKSEGVARLLTRLSKVCVSWSDAATDSRLWTTINDPNLSRNKLLQLEDFLPYTRELNVTHLRKSLTCKNMLSILPFCSKLKSINFQLKDLPQSLMKQLPQFCPVLEKATLSSGNLLLPSLTPLLTVCGPNLKYLDLSENNFPTFASVMKEIAKLCPLLEELHLQHVTGPRLVFPHEAFQIHCPKLRVLEVDEVEFSNSNTNGPGFPDLETFSCRVIFQRGPDDSTLTNILHSSKKLKNLCLLGSTAATCVSLSSLDCSLETLCLSRSKVANVGLHCIITKWKHSLKYLDLSMVGDEHVLNETIRQLTIDQCDCPLKELNLSSSAILLDVLKDLLPKCPNLTYLDIVCCRNLPRRMKQIYQTSKQIQDLRKRLSAFVPE